MLAQYPNNGVGFKIWRKTWPENKYIIVTEAQYKVFLVLNQGLRHAKFYGIKYFNDKPITP